MKVMILAAGRGERMGALTHETPKPLLCVAGEPLLSYHLRALAAGGLCNVVINVSHLAQQIVDYCGDGSTWGLNIAFSFEPQPLETAGGIQKALPLLGDAPFLVVNADVWTDFSLAELAASGLRGKEIARLVMIDNPPQHAKGDFVLHKDGWLQQRAAGQVGYTYAGIGLYTPRMFAGLSPGKMALRPLLDAAIEARNLGGLHYAGRWCDVGTPQRLAHLDTQLRG